MILSGLQQNRTEFRAERVTLLTKWYDANSGFTYFGNSAVPEPATYAALLTAGILGFTLLRRRRATRS